MSTENTGRILADALLALKREDDDGYGILLKNVRSEKALLAPGCASCANPCGRIADYPMGEFYSEDAGLQELKAGMLYAVIEELEAVDVSRDFDGICNRLFMFGYEKDKKRFALFLQEHS